MGLEARCDNSSMNAHRRNPFEVALLVLAAVLLVGAVAGFFGFAVAMSDPTRLNTCDSNGNCTQSMLQYVFQFVYLAAPGAISGAIGCAALALAVRAVDVNARRRAAGVEPGVPDDGVIDLAEFDEPQRASAAQPLDPTLFMRPRD